MDKQSAITIFMIAAAITGITLAAINPFDLDLVYAETHELTLIQDSKNDYYIDEYDQVQKSTHRLYDRIFDYTNAEGNAVYVEQRVFEDSENIQIETVHGSVILDKDTCGFSYFKDGKINEGDLPLFTDSIIPRMATNGTDNWNEITQITSESCVATWDGSILSAKRSATGIGSVDYQYITDGNKWKTNLVAINLSTNANKKFALTQTIDLNSDTIVFGGNTKNLDNFDNTTFDRTWLETNESKVINFLNGAMFDFDLSFDNLWAVTVYDTGIDKSKLSFDFSYNSQILLPGESLILDPTFTISNAAYTEMLSTTNADTVCPEVYSSDGAAIQVLNQGSADGLCSRVVLSFNTSSLPNIIAVSDSYIEFDTTFASGNTIDIFRITDTDISGDQALWDEADAGTPYVDDDTTMASNGNDLQIDLGPVFDADFAADRLAADDETAISLVMDNNVRVAPAVNVNLANIELVVEYSVGEWSPGPPTNPSGIGLPFANNFTFDMGNATGAFGSVIWNSTDNVTFDDLATVSNGTEFFIHTDLGINQTMYYKVSHYSLNNGTNSTSISLTTDFLPDAPTITATPLSETAIDIIYDSAGASDGNDLVKDFNLQASINGGAWFDLVGNSTHVNFYNHTGLTGSDVVLYGWRDGNGVGWSGSGNVTSGTFGDIIANLLIDVSNVGDTINATGILNITSGNPTPISITLLELISNGSTIATSTPSDTWNLESKNIIPIWFTLPDGDLRILKLNVTLTNTFDTVEIQSSNNSTLLREYDPDYFTALTPSAGSLNYTVLRDATTINVKMNRDLGGTWKAECLTRTLSQAIGESGGTWNNQTVIGYYQHIQTVPTTAEPYYISCYNDSLLFTTVSYLSSTNSLLLGLSIFDELGGFMGAPSVLIVILALLSMATGRNFPIVMLITASVTGILLALQLIVLDPGLVVALIVMTGISLFGIRKFY